MEESLKIIGLTGGEVSVIGVLGLFIYLGIKAFVKVWNKHEDDMKTLKREYLDILKSIKDEHKAEIDAHKKSIEAQTLAHKESLEAQRKAHLDEKTRFFGELNGTLAQLVRELQVSNEVRNKISFDLADMKRYQDEVRTAIEHFKAEQDLIKQALINNGDKLSVLLKCDLSNFENKGAE